MDTETATPRVHVGEHNIIYASICIYSTYYTVRYCIRMKIILYIMHDVRSTHVHVASIQ